MKSRSGGWTLEQIGSRIAQAMKQVRNVLQYHCQCHADLMEIIFWPENTQQQNWHQIFIPEITGCLNHWMAFGMKRCRRELQQF